MKMKTMIMFWAVFGILMLSWCDTIQKADTMMQKTDDMAKIDKVKTDSMEKIDSTAQKANNTQETNYKEYSKEIVKSEIWSGKKVILFFAASRCPSCRDLDEEIINNIKNIPNDTVILKVDYDNSKKLKVKYWVTSQHTLVYIDKDQNLVKKTTWWWFEDTIWLVK